MKSTRSFSKIILIALTIIMVVHATMVTKALELPETTMKWDEEYQVIDGFGVSQSCDVYSDQIYEFEKRDEIMDLLFSNDKGIGLSILRSEVGSGLNMPTINPEKDVWDYTAYEPEQWVINEAKKRGVEKLISTVWSPPAWMKTNGRITLGGYLKKENYNDYANYLANYIKAYRDVHGVNIDVLSIANEPEYSAMWQSCRWGSENFTDFIANYLKPTFENQELETLILVGEEGTWTDKRVNPIFENNDATEFLDIVGGHYYHGKPHPFALAKANNKHVWQTEVSDTIGHSTGFKDGVKWSKYIHDFMTKSEVNAFMYWLGASYKSNNESLIRLHEDGSYDDAKRLYSMGNFSKFVKPGYVRVGVDENPYGNLYLSAYKNPNTGEFAIVAVNNGANNETFKLKLENMNVGTLTPHITNDRYNLETMKAMPIIDDEAIISVSGYSTITYTGRINTETPHQETDWRIDDELNDWSKIEERSENWMLESNNPYNAFDHDYSRARRTSLTKEYIIYKLDNLTNFEALIYYHIALQGLSFEISSDGLSWSELECEIDSPILTGGYWEKIIVTPKNDLDNGVNYLKITFDKGGKKWDKHLSKIKIK